jgi:hypothetical protein
MGVAGDVPVRPAAEVGCSAGLPSAISRTNWSKIGVDVPLCRAMDAS